MTTIFIADDHQIILSGIREMLRDTQFELAGTASEGEGVMAAIEASDPDILLLDVRMPGASGIDVMRQLREKGDMRPVVLLTAELSDNQLLEALTLKVDGILLKESAHDQLLPCLEAVSQGKRWIEPELMQQGLDMALTRASPETSPLLQLTRRELEITRLVARGYRNQAIATQLGISEGTVKIFLHRVYSKLGVTNRTELALLADRVST